MSDTNEVKETTTVSEDNTVKITERIVSNSLFNSMVKTVDSVLDGPLAISLVLLGPIGMGISVGILLFKVGKLFTQKGFTAGLETLFNTPSQ